MTFQLSDMNKKVAIGVFVLLVIAACGFGGRKGYNTVYDLWVKSVEAQKTQIENTYKAQMAEKQAQIDALQKESEILKKQYTQLSASYTTAIKALRAKQQEAAVLPVPDSVAAARKVLTDLGFEIVERRP